MIAGTARATSADPNMYRQVNLEISCAQQNGGVLMYGDFVCQLVIACR